MGLGSTDLLHHQISTHTFPSCHDHPLTGKIPMGTHVQGSDPCHHQPIGIVHENQKVEYSTAYCNVLQAEVI